MVRRFARDSRDVWHPGTLGRGNVGQFSPSDCHASPGLAATDGEGRICLHRVFAEAAV